MEMQAKLAATSDFMSNIATLAGEGPAVGKAAGAAATAISTYQAAMGAYASMAPISPVLGIAAAAAATLDQKIRITVHHTVQKIVQSQDIIIHYTSLILCHYGKYIHQASIHVPFNVLNIGIIQYRTDLSKNSVYNFFSGKIKQ